MKPKKFDDKLLDQLLDGYDGSDPESLVGPDGLFNELRKRLIERAMDGEMTTHLGYEKGVRSEDKKDGNARNGHSSKTVKTDNGELEIEVPRDRNSDYEPAIIPKHQRHFRGFDECIVSLYSRGLTAREIQDHLKEIYKVEVSPMLISNVTDAVIEEVRTWQNRCLDSVYPIVYFDAVVVKVRHEGKVANRAIYLALAVTMEGKKEVLGMWGSSAEGAKFWLNILTELKNRGVEDIFICCVDGLSGFVPAIETVFPLAKIQLCIVHMIRNSLRFVGWKDKKSVATALKDIYRAPTAEDAHQALEAFAAEYDSRFPAISKSWKNHWEQVVPFFDYPPDIRKAIYTTNAIESLNSSFRKISRNRNLFPTEESLYKLFYLSLKNISAKWKNPIRNWTAALNRFTIEFADRMPNQ